MFFGGVVCATAVMLLPAEEQSESDGGGLARSGAAAGLCAGAGALAAPLNRFRRIDFFRP